MTRRRLLERAALVALAALWPRFERFVALASPNPSSEELRALVTGLFSDSKAAAQLGHRYLALHPDEADLGRLMRAVFAARSPHSPAARREQIVAQRDEDFRGADLAVVDGWVLARSEGRLCAAVALLQDGPHVL